MWRDGRVDFGALAPRLAYRGRRRPPEDLPQVSLLAFAVLAAGDVDVRTKALRDRRAVLEQLAGSWRPPLQLTPQTADRAEAQHWLEEYAEADVGMEGLVAKGASQRYLPGQRGSHRPGPAPGPGVSGRSPGLEVSQKPTPAGQGCARPGRANAFRRSHTAVHPPRPVASRLVCGKSL